MVSPADYLLSLRGPGLDPQVEALVTFIEEISSTLGSRKEGSETLRCLLDHCADALHATKASLMLLDPLSDELRIEASQNVPLSRVANLRLKPGEGIAGHVLQTEEPICLSSAEADPRYLPGCGQGGDVQILSVPIPLCARTVGTINIERPIDSPRFNDGDVALLRVIAAITGSAVQNLRLRNGLEQRVINLATVQQIGNLLVSTLDGEKLLRSLVTYVGEVLSAKACALYTLEEQTGCLRMRSSFGDSPEGAHALFPGQGSVGCVAERCVPLLIRDSAAHSDFDARFECYPEASSLLLAPLIAKGGLLGVLVVADRQSGQPYRDSDLEMLTLFASQAASALDNVRLYAKLERAATTDDLTGLANRRSFQEVLEKEVARAGRYGHSLSLLMLDIDHFKEVNDSYGHTVGDEVLRRLGKVLRTDLRNIDLPARYGGEEFAVIMPHTPKPYAGSVAERLRMNVEESNLFHTDRLRTVTVSIGVAAYPVDATDVDSLIDAADNALYQAKREGRNRVVIA